MTGTDFQDVMDSISEAKTIDEVEKILKSNEDYIYYDLEFARTQYLAPYTYDTYHLYAYLISDDDYVFDEDLTFAEVE